MSTDTADPIPDIPLSFSQQILWFLDVIHPGHAFDPTFTVSARYRVRGPLDVAQLRRSLDWIISRHDALRTVVLRDAAMPYQRVHGPVPAELTITDLSDARSTDRDAVIEAFFSASKRAAHDVSQPPLIWAAVGVLEPEDHVLSICVHHSVCDTWSLGVTMRELAMHYRAKLAQTPLALGPAPQHSTYSLDQQARDAPELASALDYWRAKLDAVPVCAISSRQQRADVSASGKAVHRFEFGPTVTREIERYCRRRRATGLMVLLAAFKVYLHKTTGVDDITVPTLTAGRDRPDLGGLVGFLINSLLLRTSLAGNPTLDEVVQAVRKTCLEAYAHEAPLVRVVDAVPDAALLLTDERYVVTPLQYVPEFIPSDPVELGPGCVYEPVEYQGEHDREGTLVLPLDALITVTATAGNLLGEIDYNVDLFLPEIVEDVARGIVHVTQLLCASPETRIADIALP